VLILPDDFEDLIAASWRMQMAWIVVAVPKIRGE